MCAGNVGPRHRLIEIGCLADAGREPAVVPPVPIGKKVVAILISIVARNVARQVRAGIARGDAEAFLVGSDEVHAEHSGGRAAAGAIEIGDQVEDPQGTGAPWTARQILLTRLRQICCHPALAGANLRGAGDAATACSDGASDACVHGTLVAGVLVASRESGAPGICPQCVLVVRPIFRNPAHGIDGMPAATIEELADAIVDCVNAGARVVNVSAAVTGRVRGERSAREPAAFLARARLLLWPSSRARMR